MKIFRADYVFPVSADPIKNGVVTVDDDGKIIAVTEDMPPDINIPIQELSGIICPGFVNTHCHVELSHLKDKIATSGGLVSFIKSIQQLRGSTDAEIATAAIAADAEMYENGIVAVGDIANTSATISLKANSKLYYHSFIETFAFLPEKAEETFNKALQLLEEFKPQPCSVTPHAPYSVSKDLFKLLKKYCDTGKNLISIHNQECEDENKFYRYKLGD